MNSANMRGKEVSVLFLAFHFCLLLLDSSCLCCLVLNLLSIKKSFVVLVPGELDSVSVHFKLVFLDILLLLLLGAIHSIFFLYLILIVVGILLIGSELYGSS